MIRTARPQDLPALRELERAAGEPFRSLGMQMVADAEPPSLETLAEYQRDGRAWVSVDDRDQPIAFVLLDIVDAAVHIEQISVHPGSARRGIGATLIETAAEWAAQQGFAAVTLMTFRDVPWNRPYYERLGFRIVEDGDLTAGLLALAAHETALGIDRWPRVAMRRRLHTDRGGAPETSQLG